MKIYGYWQPISIPYHDVQGIGTCTGVVTSILASFACKIIGKLASIDVTTPVNGLISGKLL